MAEKPEQLKKSENWAKKPWTVQVWEGKGKQPWRFNVVAKNGEIIATGSEGYVSKRNVEDTVERLFGKDIEIKELEKEPDS